MEAETDASKFSISLPVLHSTQDAGSVTRHMLGHWPPMAPAVMVGFGGEAMSVGWNSSLAASQIISCATCYGSYKPSWMRAKFEGPVEYSRSS